MANKYLVLTDIPSSVRMPIPTNKYEQDLNRMLEEYISRLTDCLTNAEYVTTLNQYSVSTFVITPQSAAPSSPIEGQVYFDSDDHKLKVYNGTIWEDCN